MSLITFRTQMARQLSRDIGVYALCDLDDVPIYIGQSLDSIRSRVRRHITSARSDIIANRQVDVWEIAYIRCWPITDPAMLNSLEGYLFHQYHNESPLMNGSIPRDPGVSDFELPAYESVQILPDEEIISRRRIEVRLPRQASHFTALLDHYLIVKDSGELHLALQAHFARLQKYFARLRGDVTVTQGNILDDEDD